jgi:hypothetical protein
VFAVESAAMYDPEARQSKLMEEKAAPVKVSGEFTFGAITPFDAEDARQGYANIYADFYISRRVQHDHDRARWWLPF